MAKTALFRAAACSTPAVLTIRIPTQESRTRVPPASPGLSSFTRGLSTRVTYAPARSHLVSTFRGTLTLSGFSSWHRLHSVPGGLRYSGWLHALVRVLFQGYTRALRKAGHSSKAFLPRRVSFSTDFFEACPNNSVTSPAMHSSARNPNHHCNVKHTCLQCPPEAQKRQPSSGSSPCTRCQHSAEGLTWDAGHGEQTGRLLQGSNMLKLQEAKIEKSYVHSLAGKRSKRSALIC